MCCSTEIDRCHNISGAVFSFRMTPWARDGESGSRLVAGTCEITCFRLLSRRDTRWKYVLVSRVYICTRHIPAYSPRPHTYPRVAASRTACRTHVMSHRKRESLPLRNAGHAAPGHASAARVRVRESCVARPNADLTYYSHIHIHTHPQAYAHVANVSRTVSSFRSIWSLSNFDQSVITMYFS